MPTWYSIRNRLEAGEVKARNTLERFFTGFITSYGCIDVWYRSVGSDSTQIECRIYYIQKDPSYTATESWERDNERPEYWLQIKGSEAEIRASIISLLPHIAKLHDSKRHGEWTYGATQPFAGQGSIITVVPGTGYVLVTGRFGDIIAYNDGTELNWEDITWEFDGCSPTATIPPADTLCFQFGNSLRECTPTSDPIGTCLTGDCGAWDGEYPTTEADCIAAGGVQWYENLNYGDITSDQWDDLRSCPDPEGTCVTGTCGSGWTVTHPVTEAACSGDWYKGVDLTGETNPDYFDNLYNCPDPLGCCVVGSTCNWDSISVTTQSQCTALGGTWTEGVKGQACTIEQYEIDNGCNPSPPSSIAYVVTYYITQGLFAAPLWPSFNTPAGPVFEVPGGVSYTLPPVTPGSQVTWPLALEANDPGFPCSNYTLSNYEYTKSQCYGSLTITYNFTYLDGDENEARYGIDSTVGHPGFNISDQLVTFNTNQWSDEGCCGAAIGWDCCDVNSTLCQGLHYYQHSGTMVKINGTLNGTLIRRHENGVTSYNGTAVFRPQDISLGTCTVEFGSNVTGFSFDIRDSFSKWVSAGLPDDNYPKKLHIGNVTLKNSDVNVTWGLNIGNRTYEAGGIGLYLADIEAYRASISILETS